MQSSSSVELMVMLVFLVIPALWLLISGLRGRRVGDEPRCAKCGYILLHLESLRCPECGTEIVAANTVIGRRKLRPWRAMAGLCLLLCLPMVPSVLLAARQVPWYHFKPAAFVLDDLDNPWTYIKAIKELERREKAGSLSDSARRKLIEKALQEQAATTPVRQELMDYMGTAFLNGGLTKEQQNRMFDQACRVSLDVRPVVAEGDTIPFRVRHMGRGPGGELPIVFWFSRQDRGHRIDGKKTAQTSVHGLGGRLSETTAQDLNEPAGPIGKHTLEADVYFHIRHGSYQMQDRSRLLAERTVTASVEYEVVPRDLAPKIELLESEDLRKQTLASVRAWGLMQYKSGRIHGRFHVTDAPCDLAFEVRVVTEEGERVVGSIACAKGKTSDCSTGWSEPMLRLPAKVKVVLRPSEEAARGTVDLTAIYSGEIVLEDVEVTQQNY